LRNVGDQLRQSGAVSGAAGYVDQGAELVEKLGQYLQDADSDRLIGDLESYARKQPWAIAGAALVLGFAASRFLKTSSARRYRGAGDGSSITGSYGTSTSYGTSGYGTSSYGTGASTTYGGGSGYAT
jgi:hypothetical protein